MARNKLELGIVVRAVDQGAGAVLAGVGVAATGASKAVAMMANSGRGSMKLLAGGIITLNQALELGKKAWRALDKSIGAAIRGSLEYRSANDSTTKELDAFGNSVNVLQARFGDALLPILQGIARALGPLVQSMTNWVTVNRQLIGTKVLEWAMKIAHVAVSGIAKGVTLIIDAWSGWQLVIGVVQAAVTKFFGLIATANSAALSGLSRLAGALGLDGVSEKLTLVSGAFDMLSNTMDQSAADSLAGAEAQIAKNEKLKASIVSVGRMIHDQIGGVGVKAQQALATSTAGTTMTLAQQKKASDELAAAQKIQIQEQQAAAAKAVEEVRDRARELSSLAVSVGNVWGTAFAAMAVGGEDASNAMSKALVQSARIAIMAAATAASAQMIQAHAWMGLAGITAGIIAAGIIFSVIEAKLSELPEAAQGGLVTGGIPGKDSVPILAMPGERVLTVEQNRAWERLMRGTASPSPSVGMARGGVVPRSSGAGTSVTIVQNNRLAPNRLQNKRLLRDVQRELVALLRTQGFST